MTATKSFTGRARQQKTRWGVRAGDTLSRLFITIGGIGTIAAVALVCVFLVYEVVPLFLPARIWDEAKRPAPWEETKPLYLEVDDYQLAGWALFPGGTLQVFRLDNGKLLEQRTLFPGQSLTTFSRPFEGEMAFGFEDGSLQTGSIRFRSTFLEDKKDKKLPDRLRNLAPGQLAEHEKGLVQRTPEGQLRSVRVEVNLEKPIKAENPSPVFLVDRAVRTTGPIYTVLTDDGKLRVNTITKTRNLETGKEELELEGAELPYKPPPGKEKPNFLLVSGAGDNVYLAWKDGHLIRFN